MVEVDVWNKGDSFVKMYFVILNFFLVKSKFKVIEKIGVLGGFIWFCLILDLNKLV